MSNYLTVDMKSPEEPSGHELLRYDPRQHLGRAVILSGYRPTKSETHAALEQTLRQVGIQRPAIPNGYGGVAYSRHDARHRLKRPWDNIVSLQIGQGKTIQIAGRNDGIQYIVESKNNFPVTPGFHELIEINDSRAVFLLGEQAYGLYADLTHTTSPNTPLLGSARRMRGVPRFLRGTREVVVSSINKPTTSAIASPRQEVINIREQTPAVTSDLFGYDEERTTLQRKAGETFDAIGTHILNYANHHEAFHAQLDSPDDEPIRLPTISINGKPARVELRTDASGTETVSFTSPGYTAGTDKAWELLGSLPMKKWMRLPRDPRVLAELQREITKVPGFHISRHGLRNNAVTIVNGGLDRDEKSVFTDTHPQFEAALDEAKHLIEEYFASLAKQMTPVTLHEQRLILGRQRPKQEISTPRSLGQKLIDWLGYLPDEPR